MAISLRIPGLPMNATRRLLCTSTSPPSPSPSPPLLLPRCHALAAASGSQHIRVQPPPADYDFRAETEAQTLAMVGELYPELLDIAADGSLVVVKRQTDYVERRRDGYVEPEVVFLVGTAHMSKISAMQALKADDALSVMFAEISCRFPSLLQPLVHERDMYLAWSLKRSKAVNGCKKVVGVVGKGHLKGIVNALIHDQEHLRFRDLVGNRRYAKAASRSQQVQIILKRITVETAIGSLIWWLWDNFPW